MTSKKQRGSVLIFGGAGFIGSNLTSKFQEEGWRVTVVDGLLPRTGGQLAHLRPILHKIKFVRSRIESLSNLKNLIASHDIIIDAMAWTSHLAAGKDPFYDLELNTKSHLHLIKELKTVPHKKVIFLGTRSQYGNPATPKIIEETAMTPEDIQGIHKVSAESYFRIYAKSNAIDVISLRIPNVYGPHQPMGGEDAGIVGNFAKDLINKRPLKIFDGTRVRHILYVRDLADIVFRLAQKQFSGFTAYNLGGLRLSITELATALIKANGSGTLKEMKIPKDIKAIDGGRAFFSEAKIKKVLGRMPRTPLEQALKETLTYFKRGRS
jgi:nucleoside-diphosphate-sugar epimerase